MSESFGYKNWNNSGGSRGGFGNLRQSRKIVGDKPIWGNTPSCRVHKDAFNEHDKRKSNFPRGQSPYTKPFSGGSFFRHSNDYRYAFSKSFNDAKLFGNRLNKNDFEFFENSQNSSFDEKPVEKTNDQVQSQSCSSVLSETHDENLNCSKESQTPSNWKNTHRVDATEGGFGKSRQRPFSLMTPKEVEDVKTVPIFPCVPVDPLTKPQPTKLNNNVEEKKEKRKLPEKNHMRSIENGYRMEIAFKHEKSFNEPLLKEWFEANFVTKINNNIANKLQFEKPNFLQSGTIPLILKGHDVICQSLNGSGKTMAALLPIVNFILTRERSTQEKLTPYALILAPSEKSMNEIFKQCKKITKGSGIVVVSTVSFASNGNSEKPIDTRCDILCAVLDNLKHYIIDEMISFQKVEYFIIDQAEYIEPNFLNIIRFVRQTADFPNVSKRQTLIFGSAIAPSLHELAPYLLKENYVFFQLKKIPPKKGTFKYNKEDMIYIRNEFESVEPNEDFYSNLFLPLLYFFDLHKCDENNVLPLLLNKFCVINGKLIKVTKEQAENTNAKILTKDQVSLVKNVIKKEVQLTPTVIESSLTVEKEKEKEKETLACKTKIDDAGDKRINENFNIDTATPLAHFLSPDAPGKYFKLFLELKKANDDKASEQLKSLSNENARLHQHVQMLEKQMASVVQFFSTFLATTNVSSYTSLTVGSSDKPMQLNLEKNIKSAIDFAENQ